MKLECQKTSVSSETLVEPCDNDHFSTIILAKGKGKVVLKNKIVTICNIDILIRYKFNLLEISVNKIRQI